MKLPVWKSIFAVLLLLPLTIIAAPQSYRASWDVLPADQVVKVECQVNGGAFVPVGQAPGNANLDFNVDVVPGDTFGCRARATKAGFPDSPLSGVAVTIVPLAAPTNVRIQAVP